MKLFQLIKLNLKKHLTADDQPYFIFGLFGIITYPTYHLIWVYFSPIGYENLWLRLVVVALCIPLVLYKYWPHAFIKLRPLYWYITLCYSLPFLFTFFLLKNNFSSAWVLNDISIVMLAVLLLETFPLFVILIVGILAAYTSFHFSQHAAYFPNNYKNILISYASVILFGTLFAQKKISLQQERLNTIRAIGANIAHELRTPLRAIINNAQGKNIIPILIDAYKKASEVKLSIQPLRIEALNAFQKSLNSIETEATYANNVIDILLMNIKNLNDIEKSLHTINIVEVVQNALERYPWQSKQESQLVHFFPKNAFVFWGDEPLLTQTLFNLIKNSLFYIARIGRGKIYIAFKTTSKYNQLIFQDTAVGISKNKMQKIFQSFYTDREMGSGLGLSFSKMAMEIINGSIKCESQEGKFTRFILSFPKIKMKHRAVES